MWSGRVVGHGPPVHLPLAIRHLASCHLASCVLPNLLRPEVLRGAVGEGLVLDILGHGFRPSQGNSVGSVIQPIEKTIAEAKCTQRRARRRERVGRAEVVGPLRDQPPPVALLCSSF
jgi:hypothetical protein